MTTRSKVQQKARFDILRYAQVWEDPRVLRRGLSIKPGQRVFSIAAAGDNALALLLDDPKQVVALDFNPTQLALVELKVGALRYLDHRGTTAFLGVSPSTRRLAVYKQLRPSLSVRCREVWDAHPELISKGIIHCGRFEHYFHLFRRYVLPLTQSRKRVRQLLQCASTAEQKVLYERAWNNWRWRALFKIFFGKTLLGRLGRDPAFFKFVDVSSIGEHFMRRAAFGFTELPMVDNFFAEYILTGKYSGNHGLAPYLQPEHFEVLRSRLDRLKVVHGSLEEYLTDRDTGTFDAFNLSDCFEWMSEGATLRLFRTLLGVANPGARLCYWNLLVPRRRPAELGYAISLDSDLNEKLQQIDRCFFYSGFHVETVVKTRGSEVSPATRSTRDK